MNKNNFLSLIFSARPWAALVFILGMVVGFLISRAVLSFCTVSFGVVALAGVHPREWLKNKWWLLGLFWIAMYALSYFWSIDKHYWGQRLEVKLPFLLLPLCFPLIPTFSGLQKQVYTLFTGTALLCGAVYSTSFWVKNMAYYYDHYRISQVLPTPAGQDHIRFSFAIAIYIIWAIYFLPQISKKYIRAIVIAIVALLIVYLHILAAKSGLVALYLFFIIWIAYIIFKKGLLKGGVVLLLFLGGCYLAFRYIPTLHQRIGYMSYTYIVYKQGDKSGIYGDIGRVISYDIALRSIRVHPIAGVGTGDMFNVMKDGYRHWYPQIKERDQLLPHNQFLTIALGCGIPAALLFFTWFFAPLFKLKKDRASLFFFITWIAIFSQLMVEPVLEIQFGVFVVLFFLLWQQKELQVYPETNKIAY